MDDIGVSEPTSLQAISTILSLPPPFGNKVWITLPYLKKLNHRAYITSKYLSKYQSYEVGHEAHIS